MPPTGSRACKVPPAPPLPLKNSPLEFPPLDLADMSFDFGQISDLPTILPGGEEAAYDSMVDSQLSLAENMEVDMDVADWLDSLVVPTQGNQNQNLISNHIQRWKRVVCILLKAAKAQPRWERSILRQRSLKTSPEQKRDPCVKLRRTFRCYRTMTTHSSQSTTEENIS